MTIDDLRAAWLRWMHRNDLMADLDTVQALATARMSDRITYTRDPAQTLDEWITAAPDAWLHAGLISLHELAQDDAGLDREMGLFAKAMGDHNMAQAVQGQPCARMVGGWTRGA